MAPSPGRRELEISSIRSITPNGKRKLRRSKAKSDQSIVFGTGNTPVFEGIAGMLDQWRSVKRPPTRAGSGRVADDLIVVNPPDFNPTLCCGIFSPLFYPDFGPRSGACRGLVELSLVGKSIAGNTQQSESSWENEPFHGWMGAKTRCHVNRVQEKGGSFCLSQESAKFCDRPTASIPLNIEPENPAFEHENCGYTAW